MGIGKTDGKGLTLNVGWTANLTRDPVELTPKSVNLTQPGSPDVLLVPAAPIPAPHTLPGQPDLPSIYAADLPRAYVLEGDPNSWAARTGYSAGRTAPAVNVVLLGATAVAGFSGAAVAAPVDVQPGVLPSAAAIPGFGAAAPAGAINGVGSDAAAPVALAHEVLFGAAAPAPAPSALKANIEAGGVLRPGARGPEVTELQRRLTDIGFSVRATGVYDPDTVDTVRAFQRIYRGGADGNFGPNSLSLLEAGERVTDPGRQGVGTTWEDGRATGQVQLRYINGKPVTVEAANALRPMFVAAARSRTPIDLQVVSGYRTYQQQEELYADYQAGRGNLAAPPGFSNHHSGIAVDLNTSDRGVYRWLRDNARSFGFIRTVPSEKWHWEFRPDLTGYRHD